MLDALRRHDEIEALAAEVLLEGQSVGDLGPAAHTASGLLDQGRADIAGRHLRAAPREALAEVSQPTSDVQRGAPTHPIVRKELLRDDLHPASRVVRVGAEGLTLRQPLVAELFGRGGFSRPRVRHPASGERRPDVA